ncbi:hypothetical protein [Luteococcus sp.]
MDRSPAGVMLGLAVTHDGIGVGGAGLAVGGPSKSLLTPGVPEATGFGDG